MIFNQIYDFLKNVAAFLDDGDRLDVILALDSHDGYWRRDLYAPYKADRAKRRSQDDVDWERAFEEFARLAEGIRMFTPWKVLAVSKCEADDIIFVLSDFTDNSVIIHSGDSDYLQLVSDRVSLFQPHTGEYAEFPRICKISGGEAYCRDAHEYLEYAILTGQGGKDNVYNVKTPTDFTGVRKPGFGVKAAEKMLKTGDVVAEMHKLGLYENYARNKALIDMRQIPDAYYKAIDDVYTTYEVRSVDMDGLLSVYDWPSMRQEADSIAAQLTMFSEGIVHFQES